MFTLFLKFFVLHFYSNLHTKDITNDSIKNWFQSKNHTPSCGCFFDQLRPFCCGRSCGCCDYFYKEKLQDTGPHQPAHFPKPSDNSAGWNSSFPPPVPGFFNKTACPAYSEEEEPHFFYFAL